jgi:tRNA-binding EMAP/Myf-like protein
MEEIIDIKEFAKLDLRIGKIENAEFCCTDTA